MFTIGPVYAVATRLLSGGKLLPPDAAMCVIASIFPDSGPSALPADRPWPAVPEIDVSVVVACCNVEQFVGPCMESLLGQRTDRTFEVIAVDDGSTDSTGEILDGYSALDDRIRVIHQRNRGLSGARNVGIDVSRGASIVFVDSDDEMELDAIEVLAHAYELGGCDYVTASYSTMREDGGGVRPIRGRRMHGAPWSRLYSREVWRDMGFPEGYWFEDTVQAYCVTPRFTERYVGEHLYRRRRRWGSITSVCVSSPKGLDTFWVVREMLRWCRELGVGLDQQIYDQTIRQMGPLMVGRTTALDATGRQALFACCCELLAEAHEFDGLSTTMGGRWPDVERALRTRDYGLWKVATSAV